MIPIILIYSFFLQVVAAKRYPMPNTVNVQRYTTKYKYITEFSTLQPGLPKASRPDRPEVWPDKPDHAHSI